MRVTQTIFRSGSLNSAGFSALAATGPQLVLAFGAPDILRASADALALDFSGAHRIGCTTAGEISSDGVTDATLVVTTCHFEHTRVEQASTELAGMADSRAAGLRLAQALPREGLRAVIIFGQGLQINGSAVLLGLTESLAPGVVVSGGLAGDGGAFLQTWVLDDLGLSSSRIACPAPRLPIPFCIGDRIRS